MSTEIQERRQNRSDSIGALAAALSKAQGAMEGASKANENPFFKSKYADLASVWDACRVPLSTNALAVVQTVDDAEANGRVIVETVLMHASGEWISGRIAMKPTKDDPQGIGSAITYARRYGLQAIVGIAPEDDDGNAASGNRGKAEDKETTKRTFGPVSLPKANAATVYITPKQAQDFAMRFRDSLRDELKGNADTLRHDWLLQKGFVDTDMTPTAKRIPIDKFIEVGKAAVAFAQGL